MFLLRIECASDDKDRLIAELYERGTAGIVERDLPGGRSGLDAYFAQSFESALGGEWEQAAERDWVAAAQAQWGPVLVGERFFLVPEWRPEAAPPGRIRLEMQPGLAYGSGWGPATQLALEGLERSVRPGAAVLDVGTGSGILAVAAARLGAGRVWACDIDIGAAGIARDRCRREGLSAGVFCGPAQAVADRAADVVVANITAPVLAALEPELRRVLRPGGAVVLSGFGEEDLALMAGAFGPPREVLASGEWRATIC